MKIKSVKLLKIDGLFSSYELTLDNDKVLYVPNDTDNSDYQEIQKWVANMQLPGILAAHYRNVRRSKVALWNCP